MDALNLSNIKKTYSDGNMALKGIDLTVKKGEFFGILGPNGAGKSTTIGIITGLIDKSSGTIKIFNKSQDNHIYKKYIGVVPQEFNLNPWTKVYDIVLDQAGYHGMSSSNAKANAKKYLQMLELWDNKDKFVKMLSGGMKRRLMIARALVHEPEMLILDEPTAGVDVELRANTWDFLKKINKEGKTIILTTHYLEEAEFLCKNIAIIDHGEIIENASTKELISKLENEAFVFDLVEPIEQLKNKDFPIVILDEKTIEVAIPRKKSLNDFFQFLEKNNIKVDSMRNQKNRLEQFFIDKIKKK